MTTRDRRMVSVQEDNLLVVLASVWLNTENNLEYVR